MGMAVAYKDLRGDDTGITSALIRARVEAARELQHRRGFYNAHVPWDQLRKLCAPKPCITAGWTATTGAGAAHITIGSRSKSSAWSGKVRLRRQSRRRPLG
jgi:hypothetical protein